MGIESIFLGRKSSEKAYANRNRGHLYWTSQRLTC